MINIVSYAAIAVCVIMYILINRSNYPVDAAVKYGALMPLRVKRGEYWRLLTAGFLHIQIWRTVCGDSACVDHRWKSAQLSAGRK